MNKLLGERIKTLRIARNMTQEDVSNIIDVSRQRYARIESGTSNVTLDLLTKISNIFDINVSDITSILDKEPTVEYRTNSETSSQSIFDMLDLFYANKHMYENINNN